MDPMMRFVESDLHKQMWKEIGEEYDVQCKGCGVVQKVCGDQCSECNQDCGFDYSKKAGKKKTTSAKLKEVWKKISPSSSSNSPQKSDRVDSKSEMRSRSSSSHIEIQECFSCNPLEPLFPDEKSTFESILQDPLKCKFFRDFVTNDFSQNYLDFYESVIDYKSDKFLNFKKKPIF